MDKANDSDDTEFNEGIKLYVKQLTEYPMETLQNHKWDRFYSYLDTEYLTEAEMQAMKVARRYAKRQAMTADAMKLLMVEDEPKSILTAEAITKSSLEILEKQLALTANAHHTFYTGTGDAFSAPLPEQTKFKVKPYSMTMTIDKENNGER